MEGRLPRRSLSLSPTCRYAYSTGAMIVDIPRRSYRGHGFVSFVLGNEVAIKCMAFFDQRTI
jgi:hypothetical protein